MYYLFKNINFMEREVIIDINSTRKCGERGIRTPGTLGYTAFRVQRIQPDSAISPNNVLNYNIKIKVYLMNEQQRAELKEYLETILDLYGEDEYEEFVEDIVYHYCERKFGTNREESVKTFYELVKEF